MNVPKRKEFGYEAPYVIPRRLEIKNRPTRKVCFSCPQFTVLLLLQGSVIVQAAPIVRSFQGQTIEALASWAKSRFGGPIRIERLPESMPWILEA